MNHDAAYHRLLETSWRRELTEAEQAELRAYLGGHPDARADWEAEAGLSAGLNRLPDAPVPSNFTARVLRTVELESAAAERPLPHPMARVWRWRIFVPRAAAALVFLAAGWFGFQHYQADQHESLAVGLAVVATVESPPSAEVLENFEDIRLLSPAAAADEELLELNAELLALAP